MKHDKADCIYCETHKEQDVRDLHFNCEMCGNGMCDECYENMVEHHQHYNLPFDNSDSSEDIERIAQLCENDNPEYICETCMKNVFA